MLINYIYNKYFNSKCQINSPYELTLHYNDLRLNSKYFSRMFKYSFGGMTILILIIVMNGINKKLGILFSIFTLMTLLSIKLLETNTKEIKKMPEKSTNIKNMSNNDINKLILELSKITNLWDT